MVTTISNWLNFGRPTWPRPRGGVCGREKIWLLLTTAIAQCLRLSERFFIQCWAWSVLLVFVLINHWAVLQATQSKLSLAIPSWIGTVSTGHFHVHWNFSRLTSYSWHHHCLSTCIISCCSRTQNGSTFWCQVIQVFLESWPLNECRCFVYLGVAATIRFRQDKCWNRSHERSSGE